MTLYTLTLENLNEPIPIETTILYCNNLHLAQLPESIGNLIHLQELSCSDNQLQELPKTPVTSVAGHSTCEWIGNLIHLRELYCYDNQLQELPEWIGNLINLKILSCYNNQLQELPESIGNLIHLQFLDCENNQLQQLPESIGNLTNLRELFCCYNQFTKEVNDIILKYPIYDNKAQEMLQELRDAYLIPTDNSFILK
jgi:Leucine-rich repeat (LRR) protein